MRIILMLIKNLFISDAEGAHGSTSDKRGLIDVTVLDPRWEWVLSHLLDCCDVNQPTRTENFIPELDSKGPRVLAVGWWWEDDGKHNRGVLLDAREVEEAENSRENTHARRHWCWQAERAMQLQQTKL